MKVAVIAPLGMSPPVVTSFIDHVGNVRDLVLLTTSSKAVKQGYELIRISMKRKYPKTRIHEIELPFEDVASEEQNFEFMRIAGKAIKRQKEKFGSEVVYLNVAGGRKNMCITLSILGQFLNVDGIFHVVSPDVKIVNEMLENLRPEIERIYLAESEEEKMRIYEEKERYFDSLMFPKDYKIVRIPTIPVPQDYVKRLVDVIFNEKLDSLTYSEKEMLLRHGLLEKAGSKLKVTEFGRRFAEVLAK
jgi:CRISPR-associated protein Csx14